MKKKTKIISAVMLALSIGLTSGYVFAKPPVSTCEQVCTSFCQFLGRCGN